VVSGGFLRTNFVKQASHQPERSLLQVEGIPIGICGKIWSKSTEPQPCIEDLPRVG
jgi:hypothetical protein